MRYISVNLLLLLLLIGKSNNFLPAFVCGNLALMLARFNAKTSHDSFYKETIRHVTWFPLLLHLHVQPTKHLHNTVYDLMLQWHVTLKGQ